MRDFVGSREDYVYMAGFIDAEGSMFISRENNKFVRQGYTYRPHLSIGNTRKEIINALRKMIGQGRIEKRKSKIPNAKPVFTLVFRNRQIIPILSNVYPYLRVKRRVARLLLNAYEEELFGGHSYISEQSLRKRDELYKKVKKMNKKGVRLDENSFIRELSDTKEDWLYIAGFIDGDGSIFVSKVKNAGMRQGYEYRVRLSIGNTQKGIIKVLRKLFRQGYIEKCNDKRTAKPLYKLVLQNKQVILVLKKVYRHLRIKRKLAKLILDAYRDGLFGGTPYIPEEILQKRDKLYEKIKKMNQQGLN